MPATKIHEVERVGTDAIASFADNAASLAVDFAGLEGAITNICALVDQLRVQRTELLALVREARDLFSGQPSRDDIRAWERSADAAIAQVLP